jgi:hypothetical protein
MADADGGNNGDWATTMPMAVTAETPVFFIFVKLWI